MTIDFNLDEYVILLSSLEARRDEVKEVLDSVPLSSACFDIYACDLALLDGLLDRVRDSLVS